MSLTVESQFSARKWHFTKDDIENHSPSRKDGIDLNWESYLRMLYCKFLQEIGIELKVPQVTIASAMLLCHQFYMRQSHAKHDWQTVATGCIFLACKVEETPRYLNDVVVVAYEMMNKWDPAAPRRIRQKEFFDQQKEAILVAESLVLSTIAFNLNIQLPYKPLVTALKRLKILPDLAKVAWNFVNDWIRSTLCLRYKPHYIAAGSLFLAAKLQKVKLPTENGRVWWLEFDVSLKQLEEVVQEMRTLLGRDKKPAPSSIDRSIRNIPSHTSSQSCVSSLSVADGHSCRGDLAVDRRAKELFASDCSRNPMEGINNTTPKNALLSQTSNSGCGSSSVVEDADAEIHPTAVDSVEKPQSNNFAAHHNYSKIDVNRIREAMKKRKREGVGKKLVEAIDAEMDTDTWVESELENGIELENTLPEKKQTKVLVL